LSLSQATTGSNSKYHDITVGAGRRGITLVKTDGLVSAPSRPVGRQAGRERRGLSHWLWPGSWPASPALTIIGIAERPANLRLIFIGYLSDKIDAQEHEIANYLASIQANTFWIIWSQ
jgi:hypothetical protein